MTTDTLGPFFAVDSHANGAEPDGSWQPLTTLLQPAGVARRIAQVRGALAVAQRRTIDEVPRRVAASVAHLGLAARLLSPQLGAQVVGTHSLHLDPATTWWQPAVGGPVPLSVAEDAWSCHAADAGDVVDGVVRTLTELFASESVSPQVLWGNVASAVNGAYTAMVGTRPDLAEAARSCTVDALDSPLLRGAFSGAPGRGFRRANCCLIYLLGPAATSREARQVCGDCVLR